MLSPDEQNYLDHLPLEKAHKINNYLISPSVINYNTHFKMAKTIIIAMTNKTMAITNNTSKKLNLRFIFIN